MSRTTKARAASPKAAPKARKSGTSKPKGRVPKVAGVAAAAALPTPDLGPADLRMEAPKAGATVRMYRTGLGDCFLLAFPKSGGGGPSYVLIDCGVFKGTKGAGDRMRLIAEHIRRSTNEHPRGTGKSRLDLLVVTHEHWDHLSGFHPSQAQHIFDRIEVGSVWLPWTEDEQDGMARELRGLKAATAKSLHMAYAKMTERRQALADDDDEGDRETIRLALNMLGFGDDDGKLLAAASAKDFDRDDGAGTALSWIKTRFKPVVRYREPGGEDRLPGVDGVRLFVLGPPKDEDLIRRLDPREKNHEAFSKTKGMAAASQSAFFAAFGAMPGELDADDDLETARRVEDRVGRSRPFDRSHCRCAETVRRDAEAYWRAFPKGGAPVPDDPEIEHWDEQEDAEPAGEAAHPGRFYAQNYHDPDDSWRKIDDDWLAASSSFALNVDGLANNSSLALAIELEPGGRVLLFPGDAQMGNWLSWFGPVNDYDDGKPRGQEMTWKLDDGRTVDAKDLLARTVLYKVGHHGSHNATLKKGGLEVMGTRWPDEFCAMLPVRENLSRNHTTYGEMPLTSIVAALLAQTKGRLIRADEGDVPEIPPKHAKLVPTIQGVGDLKPLPTAEWKGARRDDPGPHGLYFECSITGGPAPRKKPRASKKAPAAQANGKPKASKPKR